MTKTYTQYKLTDHQLQRLSAIANNRPSQYGTAYVALINKGLVAESFDNDRGTWCEATEKGIEALKEARSAGW